MDQYDRPPGALIFDECHRVTAGHLEAAHRRVVADLQHVCAFLCHAGALCCTGRPWGWLRVGWRGGEPSITEGRLPCRSKPTTTGATIFPNSGTGSPTGRPTMRACVPGAA